MTQSFIATKQETLKAEVCRTQFPHYFEEIAPVCCRGRAHQLNFVPGHCSPYWMCVCVCALSSGLWVAAATYTCVTAYPKAMPGRTKLSYIASLLYVAFRDQNTEYSSSYIQYNSHRTTALLFPLIIFHIYSVSQKSSPRKLFAIFSLRLSVFP